MYRFVYISVNLGSDIHGKILWENMTRQKKSGVIELGVMLGENKTVD